jgi:hypothetical protein
MAKLTRVVPAVGMAVILLALSACAPHTDYFETRAFEVTVDLTAEGRRMQITRTIECEPRRRRHAGIRPYTQWRAATKSFGERLPSGAAVMMVTPSFCRSAYRKPGMKGDELPVSPGHIPYIGWADNADNPSVIETYISPDYFKRPDARVRYHGMTARLVSGGSASRKKDAFGWFGPEKDFVAYEIGFALYARAYPKQLWKKNPELAKHVGRLNRPALLPRELRIKVAQIEKYSVLVGKDRFLWGLGLSGGPSPDVASDSGGNLEVEDLLPLLRTKDGFEISSRERGYLAFYKFPRSTRSSKNKIAAAFLTRSGRIPILVANSAQHAVFDPYSQTIYLIRSGEPMKFPSESLNREWNF